MKPIKMIALSIMAAIFIYFISVTIATTIYHKGIPYTWYVNGHFVQDDSYYGGKYYQVNDTIRVVAVAGNYEKFYVYILKDTNWIRTSAYTYKAIHEDFYDTLHYLRAKYNDYLEEQNKTDLIWDFKK